jgi:2'-5' RNA ligase
MVKILLLYRTMEATGISLWLMPEGEAFTRFDQLIARLAVRYKTPAFPPHLTLLGGLSAPEHVVVALSARLAHSVCCLRLETTDVVHSDDYFRAVVVRVKPVPALVDLRARALAAVGLDAGPPFEPHVSLLYGRLDAGPREEVVREVGRDFPDAFEVRRLDVYSTAGTVERWTRAARVPLAERRSG